MKEAMIDSAIGRTLSVGDDYFIRDKDGKIETLATKNHGKADYPGLQDLSDSKVLEWRLEAS